MFWELEPEPDSHPCVIRTNLAMSQSPSLDLSVCAHVSQQIYGALMFSAEYPFGFLVAQQQHQANSSSGWDSWP